MARYVVTQGPITCAVYGGRTTLQEGTPVPDGIDAEEFHYLLARGLIREEGAPVAPAPRTHADIFCELGVDFVQGNGSLVDNAYTSLIRAGLLQGLSFDRRETVVREFMKKARDLGATEYERATDTSRELRGNAF